jgi:hypothetical protein
MAAQTELILRVQALGEEQITKVSKMLDDLERSTQTFSNAQQRAAMSSSALQERAKQMNEEFNRQHNTMANLLPAIGAFSVAVTAVGYAFMKALLSATDYVEGLEKANLQTGISIDFWQKLIKTGAEMNTSFDEIRGAVERMERALEGDGKALAKFGIDIANFKGLSPDEAFRAMAVQIMAIKDPSERAAAAMSVFGKAGAEIIPVLAAIVSGSVDAQRAMGPDTIRALSGVDRAIDGLKTAWGELWHSMMGFVAVNVPLEAFFTHLADGIRMLSDQGLRQLTSQWIGASTALVKGGEAGIQAMNAYLASTERVTVSTHGTSKAVLEMTETLRKLNVALDALQKKWEEEAKAEEKAEAAAKKHRQEIVQGQKAAQDRALVAVAASQKEVEAELKRMNFTAAGEKDLTAKLRGEQAAQFLATQDKFRKSEAEAARYFQRVIDGVTRSSGTELQQAQRVLAEVMARRAELVANHQATNEQMRQSDAALAAAQKNVDDAKTQAAIRNGVLIAESAASVLRSLFGKSKAAAIAAAIIDTLASIVKTLAAYPWPWSLAPAAAAAAAGYAEVNKIRSQEAGFRTGTPGTSFVDFGRGSMEMLHGQEAIVTRGQADSVAAMVRSAINEANRRGGGAGQPAGTSREPIHVHLHLDSKEVADVVVRRNRAGLAPMRVT